MFCARQILIPNDMHRKVKSNACPVLFSVYKIKMIVIENKYKFGSKKCSSYHFLYGTIFNSTYVSQDKFICLK